MASGHRPGVKLDETSALRGLEAALSASGADLVICGGADGVDRLWARAASHLSIPFALYVPRGYQQNYHLGSWFTNMLWAAEEIHWTQPEGQKFSSSLNFERNIQMVEAADRHIICSYIDPINLVKEKRGGTRHCANEILKRKLGYEWVNSLTGERLSFKQTFPLTLNIATG